MSKQYVINKDGLWVGQKQLKKGKTVSADLWEGEESTLRELVHSGRVSPLQESSAADEAESDPVADSAVPVPEDVKIVSGTDKAVSETEASAPAAKGQKTAEESA